MRAVTKRAPGSLLAPVTWAPTPGASHPCAAPRRSRQSRLPTPGRGRPAARTLDGLALACACKSSLKLTDMLLRPPSSSTVKARWPDNAGAVCRKSVLPCVCKHWNAILRTPSPLLWRAVTLEPALDDRRPPGFRQVGNWVKSRAPVRPRCCPPPSYLDGAAPYVPCRSTARHCQQARGGMPQCGAAPSRSSSPHMQLHPLQSHPPRRTSHCRAGVLTHAR